MIGSVAGELEQSPLVSEIVKKLAEAGLSYDEARSILIDVENTLGQTRLFIDGFEEDDQLGDVKVNIKKIDLSNPSSMFLNKG